VHVSLLWVDGLMPLAYRIMALVLMHAHFSLAVQCPVVSHALPCPALWCYRFNECWSVHRRHRMKVPKRVWQLEPTLPPAAPVRLVRALVVMVRVVVRVVARVVARVVVRVVVQVVVRVA
jgi:hypothetical protein